MTDDLKVNLEGPMKLYYDSKIVIGIAQNPIQHDRTNHIGIDRHFVKEKLEEGLVCMSHIPSKQHVTNVLTKGLNTTNFHNL